MAEVAQPIVDGRGGQHIEGLRPRRAAQEIVELVVARWLGPVVSVTPASWIAEVVGLVDHHHVGELGYSPEPLREVTLAAEVRVAEDGEVAEVRVSADTANVR